MDQKQLGIHFNFQFEKGKGPMKIIYVPEAIRVALKSAGDQPELYLKLDNLANILSPEDVAIYIFCNMAMEGLVPSGIVQSFEAAPLLQQLESAPQDAPFVQAVRQRLLNYKVNAPDLKGLFGDGTLLSDLLDDETVRFTHFAGVESTDEKPVASEQALYERVIQQMYSFIPFEKLAALPVMAGYLACVQKKIG